jgi:hypothetical protein
MKRIPTSIQAMFIQIALSASILYASINETGNSNIPPTLLIKNDEPIPVKEFLKTLASKNNIF